MECRKCKKPLVSTYTEMNSDTWGITKLSDFGVICIRIINGKSCDCLNKLKLFNHIFKSGIEWGKFERSEEIKHLIFSQYFNE